MFQTQGHLNKCYVQDSINLRQTAFNISKFKFNAVSVVNSNCNSKSFITRFSESVFYLQWNFKAIIIVLLNKVGISTLKHAFTQRVPIKYRQLYKKV